MFSADVAVAIETGKAGDLKLRNAFGTGIAKRATITGPFIDLAEYLVSATFDYGYRGPYASTIIQVHQSLAQPKTMKDLIAEVKGTDASTLLKVIAYMYREGLIVHDN